MKESLLFATLIFHILNEGLLLSLWASNISQPKNPKPTITLDHKSQVWAALELEFGGKKKTQK
jgi:hypothetical protein